MVTLATLVLSPKLKKIKWVPCETPPSDSLSFLYAPLRTLRGEGDDTTTFLVPHNVSEMGSY